MTKKMKLTTITVVILLPFLAQGQFLFSGHDSSLVPQNQRTNIDFSLNLNKPQPLEETSSRPSVHPLFASLAEELTVTTTTKKPKHNKLKALAITGLGLAVGTKVLGRQRIGAAFKSAFAKTASTGALANIFKGFGR